MAKHFYSTATAERSDAMRLGPVKPHRRTPKHLAATRTHRDERTYRRSRRDWLAEV